MLKQHVFTARPRASRKRNLKGKRSNRQSTGYSAKSVGELKTRNRIYLAIIVTKGLALFILSIYGTGGCP